MRKFTLAALCAALFGLGGCNQNGLDPYGYSVKYTVLERTSLDQTVRHIGKLYFCGKPIMHDVGWAAVSPNGKRVIFEHHDKLFYSFKGHVQQVELPVFAIPTGVIWRKYQAEIMFSDRAPEILELF